MNTEPDRNQRKALGKGLSALLPGKNAPVVTRSEQASRPGTAAATLSYPTLPERFERFESIPLDAITANEGQPRSAFEPAKLEELAQSIRTHGDEEIQDALRYAEAAHDPAAESALANVEAELQRARLGHALGGEPRADARQPRSDALAGVSHPVPQGADGVGMHSRPLEEGAQAVVHDSIL